MKILIFLVAVVLLLWLLRKSVARRMPPRTPRDPAAAPKPMLACAQCGVHLPRDEALPGRGGVFCGEAHRTDYEQAHPERS
ncbi:MAG: PP0621 family protein [Caldimonas sp.]